MPWTRASDLERTLECQAGIFLPQSGEKSKSALEAAAWGTMAHEWKYTGNVIAPPGYEGLASLFEKRRRSWPDRVSLWPEAGKHEVAVGIDCLSGAVACNEDEDPARRDAWKTSLPEQWVSGTLDYWSDLFGIPWVDDLKTGRFCPDPATNAQFLFYGLAAYRLCPEPPDHLLLSVTHWPRYPVDKGVERKYVHVSAEELDVFEKRLRSAYQGYLDCKDGPDLVPGPQCMFCPAKQSCPEANPFY